MSWPLQGKLNHFGKLAHSAKVSAASCTTLSGRLIRMQLSERAHITSCNGCGVSYNEHVHLKSRGIDANHCGRKSGYAKTDT